LDFAELVVSSNFSFLKGASHPRELIAQAKQLGYHALAITDEATVSGSVKAHLAAKELKLKLIHGSQFWVSFSLSKKLVRFVILVKNKKGWEQLCQLISISRQHSSKGSYNLTNGDLENLSFTNCFLIYIPNTLEDKQVVIEISQWLKTYFFDNSFIGCTLLLNSSDYKWQRDICQIGKSYDLDVLATNDVLMHKRSSKRLLDVLESIRLNTPLKNCGYKLTKNSERYLRKKSKIEKIFFKDLINNTIKVSHRCDFSLDEINYEYPKEVIPNNLSAKKWLGYLVRKGIKKRQEEKKDITIIKEETIKQIAKELFLISKLNYEFYFLTVYDLVAFARSRGILCQGRGSAANSAVCYFLGITEVSPNEINMLFARFISKERNEPPDIDIDFEHQRREEVIQYIHRKYGLSRAALAASIICYKYKSAIRDVGKALSINPLLINKLLSNHQKFRKKDDNLEQIANMLVNENRFFTEKVNLLNDSKKVKLWLHLITEIIGFPRHLSQHVGGFVISEQPLSKIVPIENTAMKNRQVIQWDKNDINILGLLKVDILALGMLSAIRRSLKLIEKKLCQIETNNYSFSIQDIPPDDQSTYSMISRADTIGVFQIESRAQMSMLPRLKPKCFYDLVIEVAIVRPGPIKGGMIHPYLQRRNSQETIQYPTKEIENALSRTLGVPIFQEQVMQLAILAADFTPGEADQLRRSMAAWKKNSELNSFYTRIISGMLAKGYSKKFAEETFLQIEGFGEYGFPESHAASFASLVYASSWIKNYHPDVFLASLLNSQPLGFYATSQLIRDAKNHEVKILPVDIQNSSVETTLEFDSNPTLKINNLFPVRIGLNQISKLPKETMFRIENGRKNGSYKSITDLANRADLGKYELKILANSGALESLHKNRYEASWEATGYQKFTGLLKQCHLMESEIKPNALPKPSEVELLLADYNNLGFSLTKHPLTYVRNLLGTKTIAEQKKSSEIKTIKTSGLITHRQKPSAAKGVIFLTIEDETDTLNLIIPKYLSEKFEYIICNSKLITVIGRWQSGKSSSQDLSGQRSSITIDFLWDKSEILLKIFCNLAWRSRDFH
tara:strand:- start:7782 stop:11003 length:3222 start_codon:yes stop_codon:yes gene_type:complete